MILIAQKQDKKFGLVRIEYVQNVRQGKQRARMLRRENPDLKIWLARGSRPTYEKVEDELERYRVIGKWYRTWNASPVRQLVKNTVDNRHFDTLGWVKDRASD